MLRNLSGGIMKKIMGFMLINFLPALLCDTCEWASKIDFSLNCLFAPGPPEWRIPISLLIPKIKLLFCLYLVSKYVKSSLWLHYFWVFLSQFVTQIHSWGAALAAAEISLNERFYVSQMRKSECKRWKWCYWMSCDHVCEPMTNNRTA